MGIRLIFCEHINNNTILNNTIKLHRSQKLVIGDEETSLFLSQYNKTAEIGLNPLFQIHKGTELLVYDLQLKIWKLVSFNSNCNKK